MITETRAAVFLKTPVEWVEEKPNYLEFRNRVLSLRMFLDGDLEITVPGHEPSKIMVKADDLLRAIEGMKAVFEGEKDEIRRRWESRRMQV